MIKALTLHQPWASAIMCGHKRIETRSWATSHRGILFIHASQTLDYDAHREASAQKAPWCHVLAEHLASTGSEDVSPDVWPTGCLLGFVNLAAVLPTEEVPRHARRNIYQSALGSFAMLYEEKLGDFSPGRFAWLLSGYRRFEHPIPMRGYQRIWTIPEEFLPAISRELGIPEEASTPERTSP